MTDIVEWSNKKGLKTEAFAVEDDVEILGVNSRGAVDSVYLSSFNLSNT
ncbi:MAG: hypothetical protein MZV64_26315 [Ignavibacteriales bacterium]|nr:hypothetical protein [Ignavibacteriales bacterium]